MEIKENDQNIGTDGRYLSASCDKSWQPATISQCIAMCKREGNYITVHCHV